MLCSKCDTRCDPNARFCGVCGEPSAQASQQHTQHNAPTTGPMGYGSADGSAYNGAPVPFDLLEKKSIAVCIILSIVTFGIYSIYWLYTFVKKIKLLNGEEPNCVGEVLLNLFIPFYFLYWVYTRSNKLYHAASGQHINVDDFAVVNLILSIFGFSIVAYALIQHNLNTVASQLVGRIPSPYYNQGTM